MTQREKLLRNAKSQRVKEQLAVDYFSELPDAKLVPKAVYLVKKRGLFQAQLKGRYQAIDGKWIRLV